MDTTQNTAPTPGLLKLGGREFVVLPAKNRDLLATNTRMKELARDRCVSPLDYVLGHAHLAPGAMTAAIAEAIKIGSGGGVEPTPEAVWDQYTTLEGVRWRVYYHVSRVLKDFKPEDAAKLVTDDNVLDAAEALDAALNFRALDEKKETPAPASGASS